jgi:hypothetical protein
MTAISFTEPCTERATYPPNLAQAERASHGAQPGDRHDGLRNVAHATSPGNSIGGAFDTWSNPVLERFNLWTPAWRLANGLNAALQPQQGTDSASDDDARDGAEQARLDGITMNSGLQWTYGRFASRALRSSESTTAGYEPPTIEATAIEATTTASPTTAPPTTESSNDGCSRASKTSEENSPRVPLASSSSEFARSTNYKLQRVRDDSGDVSTGARGARLSRQLNLAAALENLFARSGSQRRRETFTDNEDSDDDDDDDEQTDESSSSVELVNEATSSTSGSKRAPQPDAIVAVRPSPTKRHRNIRSHKKRGFKPRSFSTDSHALVQIEDMAFDAINSDAPNNLNSLPASANSDTETVAFIRELRNKRSGAGGDEASHVQESKGAQDSNVRDASVHWWDGMSESSQSQVQVPEGDMSESSGQGSESSSSEMSELFESSDEEESDTENTDVSVRAAANNEQPTPVEAPFTSVNEFKFVKKLGRGAYGKVFLVRDIRNDLGSSTTQVLPLFAVKVISKRGKGKKYLNRSYFDTEVDLLNKAQQSPFAVAFHSSFENEKAWYIVMEYCNRGTLRGVCERETQLEPEMARMYIAQLVLAIDSLHEHDIVHYDLKPANVLLDHDGNVCIADFGLAESDVKHYTSGGMCPGGTRGYRAPETVQDKPHGKAVDWYALGVMALELLTGRGWGHPKFESQLACLRQKVPPQLSMHKYLSDDAIGFLKGLLHEDPRQRLGSGGVQSILEHEFFLGMDWDLVASNKLPEYEVEADDDDDIETDADPESDRVIDSDGGDDADSVVDSE